MPRDRKKRKRKKKRSEVHREEKVSWKSEGPANWNRIPYGIWPVFKHSVKQDLVPTARCLYYQNSKHQKQTAEPEAGCVLHLIFHRLTVV